MAFPDFYTSKAVKFSHNGKQYDLAAGDRLPGELQSGLVVRLLPAAVQASIYDRMAPKPKPPEDPIAADLAGGDAAKKGGKAKP